MKHRDQRRFVITQTIRDAKGKPISIRGHLIGPGPRSVISIHRKVAADIARQVNRRATGRFVWWPGLFNSA